MWQEWLATFPEMQLLSLDIGGGGPERRWAHPIPLLAQRLLSPVEGALVEALALLAVDNFSGCGLACRRSLELGIKHPDLLLVASACALHEGRCEEAREFLAEVYLRVQGGEEPRLSGPLQDTDSGIIGVGIRRLYPALRFVVRITPAQLLPVHPSPYGAALLYAVALNACGERQNALSVLREMAAQFGLHDELRIMAAGIHLAEGNLDAAYGSLVHSECAHQDALEFTRSFYLAYCLERLGKPRQAAQELGRALRTIQGVNPQTEARARLLAAELYHRSGLPLDALRESGSVDAEQLPQPIAAEVLRQEEAWLAELEGLPAAELERLAKADVFQAYIPDPAEATRATRKLDISRDPLSQIARPGMSWAEQQRHEQQLVEARAAMERGEVAVMALPKLSPEAADIQRRIVKASEWWPQRRNELLMALPRPELLMTDSAHSGHLRFDYRGRRELEFTPLQGEHRAAEIVRWAGIVALLGVVLVAVRTCLGA
jgi:tetratricopeptide (TPR) repeat protein